MILILIKNLVFNLSISFSWKFNQQIILFFLIMYLIFYVLHFFIEKNLDTKKLIGKDLAFIVLKFLTPLFYALIYQYNIDLEQDRKIFLLHFLFYAIIFLILDTFIYYQIIKKKNG